MNEKRLDVKVLMELLARKGYLENIKKELMEIGESTEIKVNIPCGIESVEKLSIDAKTGKVEMVMMVNNEKVENTRVVFEAMVTQMWAEDKHGERHALSVFRAEGDSQ